MTLGGSDLIVKLECALENGKLAVDGGIGRAILAVVQLAEASDVRGCQSRPPECCRMPELNEAEVFWLPGLPSRGRCRDNRPTRRRVAL